MRVKQSILNVSTGLGSQAVITLLGFLSRTVFISSLGVHYLGINGLFTNVLGMLGLAEAGIGASIIYSLYKPVADGDERRIAMLIRLYKKAYLVIALVVLGLGLVLLPFLPKLVGHVDIDHLNLYYLLFLVNTSMSYLFAHKISLLNVSQKGYIVTGTYTIYSIVSTLLRIGVLLLWGSYLLYLIVDMVSSFAASLVLSRMVDRMHPYLRKAPADPLDPETKTDIIQNIRALVLHNIGGYCVFGTDNILISSFVGVAAVGLYSNYYMLMNICRTLINQVFDNLVHSVGNLVAETSESKVYDVFKVMLLFNFWIYSFFTIGLYVMLEPFIRLWLGSSYLLGSGVLEVLMINFYVSGMRRAVRMVKTTAGIFRPDRYASFVEAAINLGVSILLVRQLGIAGVFLGTLASTLAVPFWVAPWLVYRSVFRRSVWAYFRTYGVYFAIGLGVCAGVGYVCGLLPQGVWGLAARFGIVMVVPHTVFIALFGRTAEYQYLRSVAAGLGEKVVRRFARGRVRLES